MIPFELEEMLGEIRTPVMFAAVDQRYPHATPMNWLWLKSEGVFWFNPAGGTRKIKLLQRNENVCFGTLDEMENDARGFMVWGEITRFEYGFWALGRNRMVKKQMLIEKSQIKFNLGLLKFWRTYARHPDIHYSTLPWVAAFVRVTPKRIVYWQGDGVEKEIVLSN
ncbi:MAG: pyridoxamine 5'-phosphate oxidase family protein [Candidatus Hydrothermarchaeales archaeon]